MLRVVIPVRTAAITVYVAVRVYVAVEVVVVINLHIIVAPSGPPTPTATPHCAHRHPDSKRDRHSGGVVSRRRIVDWRVGVHWSTVHDHRIVRRHVDDFGISLLDQYHSLALHDFGLDFLLLSRLQVAFVFCFFSHALHGLHHITLLRKKRVAKVGGPLNVVRQALHHVW